jgi:DNA-binding Lrp family transcriptional regulator
VYSLKLDEVDSKIIYILQENCKLSAREIASKLDIPITTIYSKISRMEDAKIIEGYKALLNAKKLDRGTTAFILASVAYSHPRRSEVISQRQVAKNVARFPEVQEVHIISGDWDLLIKVKTRNVEAVGNFIVDKLRTVEGIEKTLTCMVFDTQKEEFTLNI